ncbi:MAG: D-sedoheptulose 7-phosphate isomerase, partial [Acidimicrobiaceae bacterium]|nr:D-sedoheptulose 7-phosphate isomerase [Acidimicrobiaceae bacterium]
MSATESFATRFIEESIEALTKLDLDQVEAVKRELVAVRERGGRLFIIGSGGGAGHASHAVNDFRKIAGIEAYSPSDNVSELTARINDEGWDTSYSAWLAGSRLRADDLVLVFSVGGGDQVRNISTNLVNCLLLAKRVGARICGIVGRDGGETARLADACILIPVVSDSLVTPHTEGLQAVVWHLLVSEPEVQVVATRW